MHISVSKNVPVVGEIKHSFLLKAGHHEKRQSEVNFLFAALIHLNPISEKGLYCFFFFFSFLSRELNSKTSILAVPSITQVKALTNNLASSSIKYFLTRLKV